MSSESLAMTRRTMGPELAKLAEEHMKHEYAPQTPHPNLTSP